MIEKEEQLAIYQDRFGFLYENGVNLGILSCIQDKKCLYMLDVTLFELYECYLKGIHKQKIINTYVSDVIDKRQRALYAENCAYYTYMGFVKGQNIFREYLKNKIRNPKDMEVVYFQADFLNAFERNYEEQKRYFTMLFEKQLGVQLLSQQVEMEMRKGGLFHADTFVLLKEKEKYHLFCADESISQYSVLSGLAAENSLQDLLRVDFIHKKLSGKLQNLSIDSTIDGMNIGKRLYDYAIGTGNQDKTLNKMVQAGSYVYSFLHLLKKIGRFQEADFKCLDVCLFGITFDDFSSIDLPGNDILTNLEPFYHAYRYGDNAGKETTYEEKKNLVYRKIAQNFFGMMQHEDPEFHVRNEWTKEDVVPDEAFVQLRDGKNIYTFFEHLHGFQNTEGDYQDCKTGNIGFRDAHKEMVTKYLLDPNIFTLFLSGNPGIGKTTSLVDILKETEDGFLFLYVSPRKQVNEDVLNKFTGLDGLVKDRMVYLTATGNDYKKANQNKSVSVVRFYANDSESVTSLSNKMFEFQELYNRNDEAVDSDRKIYSVSDRELMSDNIQKDGVLKRVCEGIRRLIEGSTYDQIIASCSIQSYQEFGYGSTINHIANIFRSFYRLSGDLYDEEKAKAFFSKIPRIYVMIDEITGDSAGVKFYNDLKYLLFEKIYSKFSPEIKERILLKLIVADASLNNPDVIVKHLKKRDAENDKIYFSVFPEKESAAPSLKCKELSGIPGFEHAVCINTNSYPAEHLYLEYKFFVEAGLYKSQKDFQSYKIQEEADHAMLTDALNALEHGFLDGEKIEQIIIYIQDKNRLLCMEEALQKHGKEKWKHYIRIDSSNSAAERKRIIECMNTCELVLMTSSASRGLSFQKTSLFFVDICKFSIERNFMEIIQLIYRARGGGPSEQRKSKKVVFYLSDVVLYARPEEKELVFQNYLKDIYTLFTLLHGCILTRICGNFTMNHKCFSLIPVSGISTSSPFSEFIEFAGQVYRNTAKEYNRTRNQVLKSTLNFLSYIFDSTKLVTNRTVFYDSFESMHDIKDGFEKLWSKGYDALLSFQPFFPFYVYGNMGIFPIQDIERLRIESFLSYPFLKECYEQKGNKHSKVSVLFYYIKQEGEITDDLKKELGRLKESLDQIYYASKKYEKTQVVLDTSKGKNQYIALSFASPFYGYQEQATDSEESQKGRYDFSLRMFFEVYLKTRYSFDCPLPVTDAYKDIPFLKFRSHSFLPLREQIFHQNYMFYSSEVNLLNLLLSTVNEE